MRSMIVNMVEKMKDAEDLKLEALFATDSVPDAGFSARIEKRVRRQMLVRRFTMPAAVLIGGIFAAKPLIGLLSALFKLLAVSPQGVSKYLGEATSSAMPSVTMITLGGMIAVAFLLISRMLED